MRKYYELKRRWPLMVLLLLVWSSATVQAQAPAWQTALSVAGTSGLTV